MSAETTPRYAEQLAETVGEYGPWKALELFTSPELNGLDRVQLRDATVKSLWATVERGNPKEVDDHLLVIEYMERAVVAEILADLVRAKETGLSPDPTAPVPVIMVETSPELV